MTLYRAAAAMRVIVTEGILCGETHRKVTDKVSLLLWGFFLFFFEEYFFFFFFYLDTLDFFFVSETAGRLPANTDRSKLFISGKWERVEDESCPCLIYCALVSFWGYQIESARIQQHIKLNICRTDSNLITKLFQFH